MSCVTAKLVALIQHSATIMNYSRRIRTLCLQFSWLYYHRVNIYSSKSDVSRQLFLKLRSLVGEEFAAILFKLAILGGFSPIGNRLLATLSFWTTLRNCLGEHSLAQGRTAQCSECSTPPRIECQCLGMFPGCISLEVAWLCKSHCNEQISLPKNNSLATKEGVLLRLGIQILYWLQWGLAPAFILWDN